MKNKEIVIPILNDEYKVIFTWGNAEQIKKVLESYGHQEWATIGMENDRGRCFYTSGSHPVIAMPGKPKTPTEIGTLAHEATHAVEYLFDYISEKPGGEIFAHSIGAIVRRCLSGK